MKFRIGLRTVKTVLSATVAYFSASLLGLTSPATAGIIAVISLTNTKRSTFKIGFSRLFSFVLATPLAFISFHFIGYNALGLGSFLLVFIPVAVMLGLGEGIVVSSVLVTHFIAAGSVTWQLIGNGFALLVCGVGFAWLANLYMPRTRDKIEQSVVELETDMRALLRAMKDELNSQENVRSNQLLKVISAHLKQAQQAAENLVDNQLGRQDVYFLHYFELRLLQVQILRKMVYYLQLIEVEAEQVAAIQQLLELTATSLGELNDGQEFLSELEIVWEHYREQPLPQSRAEFENRANMYQFLREFQRFIELKTTFYAQHVERQHVEQ